jgi:hypothetical protein
LDDLTYCQQPSGNWELQDVAKYFACDEATISKANVTSSLQIWITLLVLQLLERIYADCKQEWLLIAEKALQWVKRQEKEDLIKTWVAKASEFANKFVK